MLGAWRPTVAAVLAVIAVREVAAVGVAVLVGRHGVKMRSGVSGLMRGVWDAMPLR